MRGTLIEAGRRAKFGYPGLIFDPDEAPIEVFVFESRALPNHWHRLDAFEGPGYRRIAADVWTAEGVLPASIYVIADPTNALLTRTSSKVAGHPTSASQCRLREPRRQHRGRARSRNSAAA